MIATRRKSIAAGFFALAGLILAASAAPPAAEEPQRATPSAAPAASAKTKAPARRRPGGERELHAIRIAGRVCGPLGSPIAGATVYITDANRRRASLLLATATTAADGTFRAEDVRLPVWTPEPGPVPKPAEGRFEVAASAPGFGFAWLDAASYRPALRPENAGAEEVKGAFYQGEPIAVELVLGPPARLRGRVVDDLGQPVAGVKVQVGFTDDERRPHGGGTWYCAKLDRDDGADHEFNGIEALPEALRAAQTDADGRYQLDGLPREAEFLTLIDAGSTMQPLSLRIATTERRIAGERSVGHDGTLDHTFVRARAVHVRVHDATGGGPAAGVFCTARGEKIQRAGALGRTGADGIARLALPPGHYTLAVEPPIGSSWLASERTLDVAREPAEQTIEVPLSPGASVVLEAVDAERGAGLAGVGFSYTTDTTRQEHDVRTTPAFVDHPTTGADGRLRVTMEPGARQFRVTQVHPFFSLPEQPSAMVALKPGETTRVRFTLAKDANPAPPDAPLRPDFGPYDAKAHFRCRRYYYMELEGIALADLRALLDGLDPKSVPPIVERIAERFPTAAPPSDVELEDFVDGAKHREQLLRSNGIRGDEPLETFLFNGEEAVRYSALNAQVDIYDELRIGMQKLVEFRDQPGSGSSRNGAAPNRWVFGPKTYPKGVTLATATVEIGTRGEQVQSIFVRFLDSVDFDVPIPPETFLCAVAAGTNLLDYRDDFDGYGADDPRPSSPAMRGRAAARGVLRGPVMDIVAYADRLAATRRRPEPARIKEGDIAPPLAPAHWLDQNGKTEPADLKGKIVLIDFWGITCGPCVGQLPEVREAARHFAGTDLVIVGLHDSYGTVPEVAAFARQRQLDYPLAIDRADKKTPSFGATFADFGIHAIPSAVVLDRQGRVIHVGTFGEALARAAALVTKPTP
jgi:peroxiredoxin